MIKIYMAGPLFTEADKTQRILEEELINELLFDKEVFNPITQPINDKSTNPTAQDIFNTDTEAILDSDIILACLDGEDPGVMYELGLVHGFNLETRVNGKKYKKVIPYATDIRFGSDAQKGFAMSVGMNQYVRGGLFPNNIHSSFESALQELRQYALLVQE